MALSAHHQGIKDEMASKTFFYFFYLNILLCSGHCMMEDEKLCSPKTFSAATSPIKDSVQMRYGSRELGLVKKLVNRDVQTEKYQSSGIFHSSSSSEKVN